MSNINIVPVRKWKLALIEDDASVQSVPAWERKRPRSRQRRVVRRRCAWWSVACLLRNRSGRRVSLSQPTTDGENIEFSSPWSAARCPRRRRRCVECESASSQHGAACPAAGGGGGCGVCPAGPAGALSDHGGRGVPVHAGPARVLLSDRRFQEGARRPALYRHQIVSSGRIIY